MKKNVDLSIPRLFCQNIFDHGINDYGIHLTFNLFYYNLIICQKHILSFLTVVADLQIKMEYPLKNNL